MKKLFAANWKMYLSPADSQKLLRAALPLGIKKTGKIELVICPQFLVLGDLADFFKKDRVDVKLGAQDCFWEPRGAYTGEISAVDLKKIGCFYVILGHSERRRYLKETDEMINKKLKAAAQAGLTPILCVGESAEERKKEITKEIVKKQITEALKGVDFSPGKPLVVAYEPVWAIGSGSACSAEEASQVAQFIKLEVGRKLKKRARVLYGGSVDAGNIVSFLGKKNIDGVLVGGASAKRELLLPLLKRISQYAF
ncbi:MAG: triose-phosphate isomerase [Candidatus Magasanikbacteria bacterium]|nr:triose-phosphate isomerase [Candidatus Magasanikbacteria bacterium]